MEDSKVILYAKGNYELQSSEHSERMVRPHVHQLHTMTEVPAKHREVSQVMITIQKKLVTRLF